MYNKIIIIIVSQFKDKNKLQILNRTKYIDKILHTQH